MTKAHAKFSASQSKRWMSCPGSITVIDNMPKKLRPPSSEHAALGTAAHALVAECLNYGLKTSRSYRGYWISRDDSINKQKRDPDAFEVDLDMMNAVDVMLDTVYAEMDRLGPAAELKVEHKFDLSWLRPNMFGTNDTSISLFLEELVVIDYKHGQGVPVEVCYTDENTGKLVGNSQCMYYALGAAKEYDFTHEIITLIIVQPRCPHKHGGVRRFTVTRDELLKFKDKLEKAVDIVNQGAEEYQQLTSDEALKDWNGLYLNCGDHCQSSFCSYLAICPALHSKAQELAKSDFMEPAEFKKISPPAEHEIEKIAKILKWVPLIDKWIKEVEAMAQRAAENGIEVPGHKLVRKRANRSWVEPEETIVKTMLNLPDVLITDLYTTPKLKSPAQMEDLGKEARKYINGHKLKNDESWIVKPLAEKGLGGLTLAQLDDPRDAVSNLSSIQSDFDDEYFDGDE